jgi:hypothetical protein
MTAIATRRTLRDLRSIAFTLATADDLNGTVDGTQAVLVSGAARVLLIQSNVGTGGTSGIDVVEVSYDGGVTWAAASDVLPVSANDLTGTIQASGALNSAGTEPTLYAAFTCGPYEGYKTYLRIGRGGSGALGTAWSTGAPSVYCVLFGGNHIGGAVTTQA